MDFVMDALAGGRRIKILCIVDDCTRESIDLVVDFGISGHHVTRVLDQADSGVTRKPKEQNRGLS